MFISRLVVVVVVDGFVVVMGSDPFFNLLSWGALDSTQLSPPHLVER